MPLHRLILLLLLSTCLGVGAVWLSEYHKIYLGRTCHKNLALIEEAKRRFEQAYPGSQPLQYSEISKLLPSGFPSCPWGGTYSHEINLNLCTQCSMNGNPKTEPDTPRTNPKQNGFCDLEPEGPTRTILTKIWNKLLRWTTPSNPSAQEIPTSPLDSPAKP